MDQYYDGIIDIVRGIRDTQVGSIAGAMEKALAEDLVTAGYAVMNIVRCNFELDQEIWKPVRQAFAEHFPALNRS